MKKLLSQRVAERAKPQTKPYQIHDTAIPGFILRIQPSGTKIWKLIQDKKPRTLGKMPVTTYGMASDHAARILRGEEDEQERKPMTLDQFLDQHYQEWVKVNHSQPDDTINRLQRIGLGKKQLDEITVADVETWRVKRQQVGRAATTINRDVATLNSALAKAVDWNLLDQHPLSKLKPLKVDKRKKPRYLSKDEEKRLYAALVARDDKKRTERESGNRWREERGHDLKPELGIFCDNLTPMVTLAINTGLRRGELWNLCWSDIDLKKQILTVLGKGAKSGQTRHIPLNADAVSALKTHRGSALPLPHKPVFGRAEFRTAWEGVLSDAEISGFRFHDLRHTFASKLVMAGVPLNTVRELMGHSSLEMTLIYAHLAPDNLKEAVDLISSTGSNP
jgi:integrase